MLTSNFLKPKLARCVREHLDRVEFRRSDYGTVRLSGRMRERIVDIPSIGKLKSNNRFLINLSTSEYSDTLSKEWTLGLNRVSRQRASIRQLLEAENRVAPWIVVSTYYALLFSSLELLRAMGRWITFLSEEDLKQVKNNAPYSSYGLDSGTYVGVATADNRRGGVSIDFSRQNRGFHELCWTSLAGEAKRKAKKLRRRDPLHLMIKILAGEDSWTAPNTIRNRWNYREPSLYKEGNSEAEEFCKLACKLDSCCAWHSRRHRTDSVTAVSSLAFAENYAFQTIKECEKKSPRATSNLLLMCIPKERELSDMVPVSPRPLKRQNPDLTKLKQGYLAVS